MGDTREVHGLGDTREVHGLGDTSQHRGHWERIGRDHIGETGGRPICNNPSGIL